MGTGALLAIVGGGFLFGPIWPSDLSKISIWQAHDICSSLLGSIAPSGCSTLTLLWAIGLALLGLGVLVVVANLFGSSEPPARYEARPARPPATPPPALVQTPTVPVAEPISQAATTEARRERRSARRLDQRTVGLAMVVGGTFALAVLIVVAVSGIATTPTEPGSTPFAAVPGSTLVATSPPSPSAAPTETLSPTPLPILTVDIPVIPCATTYGTDEVQQPTEPTARRSLPGALANRLAIFATNYDQVLAPREWRCIAQVGANGTSVLTVASGSTDDPAAVIAENAAASYGEILDLACPLFPAAAREYKAQLGSDCAKPPDAEVVDRTGATIARFMDGAGITGTGAQSGGSYPAFGAITYVTGQDATASKVTCLLPFEDEALCIAIVNDWLGR
jgi:hypothetical protein